MDQIADQYGDDDELQVIAAEARMVADESWLSVASSPEVDRAIARLEKVLARNPDSTSAIHMYIHATARAQDQQRALSFATRLATLAPAAGHLVHMPTHVFFRVGRYGDAVKANLAAIGADEAFARQQGLKFQDVALHAHNFHFGYIAALLIGDGAVAMRLGRFLRDRFPADHPHNDQVHNWTTYIADGLHADPRTFLSEAMPEVSEPVRAMWHYARGEAEARLKHAEGVRREGRAIRAILGEVSSNESDGEALVAMAALILDGRAEMLSGNPQKAASAFARAAEYQDRLLTGNDPPGWWYSVRRSEGAAHLAAGDYRKARAALNAANASWPNDPLTFYAFSELYCRQGQQARAAAALDRAHRGWVGPESYLDLTRL